MDKPLPNPNVAHWVAVPQIVLLTACNYRRYREHAFGKTITKEHFDLFQSDNIDAPTVVVTKLGPRSHKTVEKIASPLGGDAIG